MRAGLRALLASAPDIDVVGEAATGEDAIALTRKLTPDVVLMDLQLGPGMTGVDATRHLAAAGTPVAGGGTAHVPHVLVLTAYDTDADITRAIEAGYLLKAERPEELFAALHAAVEGRTTLSAPVADRVMARLRTPHPTLTPREHDILSHLSQGLANRDIARGLFISEATVKTHLRRIYDKLGVDTRAGAVAVAKERRLAP